MPKRYWISNLRVFATIAVIFIHASAGGLTKFNKIPAEWWWICNWFDSFGRFAVPVFVMLSGYLLIDRYENLSQFLSKRLSRVVVPFLLWSCLYVLWSILYEKKTWTIHAFINKILSMQSSDHLWFIYMIVGLYAFLPVISRWLKQAPDTEIQFFLLAWFVVNSIYPLVERIWKIEIGYDLRNFSGYVGYFVLGHYLKRDLFKFSAVWCLISFIGTWIIAAVGTFYLIRNNGIFDSYFYNYLSPNVIIMSVSIFVFFQKILDKPFAEKPIALLDACSFGIYLAHLMVLRTLSRQFQINYIWKNPLIGICTHALLCLLICFCLTWLIRKVPKGDWLTG